MKNKEFGTYHPFVNFLYFVTIIGFSCLFMHPICLCISFFSAYLYSVIIGANIKPKYIILLFISMSILNPLFNHEGVTILSYFPNGNPLTLESIIYGVSASVMLISVVCWFSAYNEIMTSDKFIYLFGRIIPSMSLVLSMTLRFVPRFTEKMKKVLDAQKTIGKGIGDGNIIKRAKNGLSILSAMITWSFENAIDTADSMKSRGYGAKGRTSFSIFSFDKRDRKLLILIILLSAYIIVGKIFGAINFIYFPSIKMGELSFYSLSVFIAYLLLCFIPIIIEIWEVRRWKALISKI